ncbi:hypothetical protein N7492_002394 [Penicillium capsulatum]|uniref:Selenoprotein W-like protein n=1 Tax=Penicillium capsulatum TaxID=69766 RepID=A0A9W9LVZ7_9EURO|nr:hypothetical protein N7492_002394 [Penicillium capsulatum]KAJ6123001.1 hypothetical protein N7512_005466 [Penicillium capsulatum]
MATPAQSTGASSPSAPSGPESTAMGRVHLPRITIQFCTQCRWMLRAAYFAQELLSTFNTDLGEVALVPKTGGIFTVTIFHGQASAEGEILWDRKRDGGFPEVKALKSLVRNVIAPDRDLGHTDRALKKNQAEDGKVSGTEKAQKEVLGKTCDDCAGS